VFQVRESLPREGRCYDLVWLLDAALAQRRLTLPHMRKLAELMQDHIKVRHKRQCMYLLSLAIIGCLYGC
jgi:hypothetical protein